MCFSAPIKRGSELRCAALVSVALRALPRGHRKPFPASVVLGAGESALRALPIPTSVNYFSSIIVLFFTDDFARKRASATDLFFTSMHIWDY